MGAGVEVFAPMDDLVGAEGEDDRVVDDLLLTVGVAGFAPGPFERACRSIDEHAGQGDAAHGVGGEVGGEALADGVGPDEVRGGGEQDRIGR